MAYTAALIFAATPIRFNKLYTTKVRSDATLSSSTCSASSISSTESATEQNIQKFSYSRASPTVRWPHLKLTDNDKAPRTQSVEVLEDVDSVEQSQPLEYLGLEVESQTLNSTDSTDVALEMLGKPSRTKAKKMTKLALKRAKDWRQRVQFLMNKILQLQPEEFVADVLDNRSVQMTPTDFCYVVKSVGQSNWQRALEVYEWLNLQHWYSPNARMLATILSVLGKANEEALAVEIFTRAEPSVGNTVQVYNAMMGVYARNGRFLKVQELIDLMPERGCEPDLVSYNTLINARAKSGSLPPGSAVGILNEVRKSGLRPDVVTYNTLISACYKGSTLEEALKIYEDMESHKCQSDIWTYNSMISVYGQCGMAVKAEQLYKDLGSKGFFPDLVTYNALLSAFAREGNVVKVKEIYKEMVDAGFARDAMAYNTIINMYGKQGQHDLALQTYIDMQSLGCIPDAVTYTVLINSLGKAGRIAEAANVMSEMLAAGVKPTVRTFSALICGYAKAGMRVEAEETFHCMLRSGVKPDHLAYLVMLDIFVRSSDVKKAMGLYKEMVHYDFRPEEDLYQALLNLLMKERKEEEVDRVIKDMELHGMIPEVICTLLVKGECYDHAAKMLKLAAPQGCEPDSKNLLPILSSYSSSGRHTEAYALLDSLREHAPRSHNSLTEALIILLCEDHKLDAAMEEYRKAKAIHGCNWSCTVYESLIHCCNEAGLLTECSQLYSDMKFCGVELSFKIFKSLINIYCKLGFPETSHYLVDHAESLGFSFDDFSVYVDLIEVYGKLTLLERAESLVGRLRLHHSMVDRKVWNALIHAYAANGCYEKARAVFNVMIRDGPSPTVDSINGLLQALIIDGRLDELYVVIQELQDMDFKISKSSIILMLDAFARAGNIFEVKKIYHGMKAAGYFPTMHLYRSMIGLFSRGKRVRDVESMVSEMEEAGFKPDLQIYNSLLKLYTAIEDFRKTAEVYLELQASGLKPDAETYNTLILMYSRDRRPEEGLSLLCEMKKQGMDLKLDTFKSLISACGKQQLWEQAEELFEDLRLKGLKLDRSFYHMMLKIYRDSGSYSKAENVLVMMKEADLEPSIATMHLLMVSYGSAGQPREAEKVLNNLKTSGLSLSTLPYSSVIDAYLKNRDYHLGIEKLSEMREDGMEPDHRIWTCFIRAASLSQVTSEAMILLNSLRDTGFDLPIRLLTEKAETLVAEVDNFLLQLVPLEDNAAFNFVNALEDLLWAFERRATASWLFQLAIKRQVYRHDIFRVSEKDWGADFRKLSPGAALVGLTLWLDHMQDASLQGSPESPKSVVLITGTAEYNMVSLNKTLKAYLWEMGSPFLPCKTRTGLLVAKGHSLRMWLKDSPFCLDLELKDAPSLPESNSVQLSEGCFMRSCLVPVFNEIHERLGKVRPKKFARLALLSDEKREKVIRADLRGRKEKLEKLKKRGEFMSSMKKMSFGKRKFIRKRTNPDRLEEQVKR